MLWNHRRSSVVAYDDEMLSWGHEELAVDGRIEISVALQATIDGSEQAQPPNQIVALTGTMAGLQYCKYSLTQEPGWA